jgi:hypothetical protein
MKSKTLTIENIKIIDGKGGKPYIGTIECYVIEDCDEGTVTSSPRHCGLDPQSSLTVIPASNVILGEVPESTPAPTVIPAKAGISATHID